jgi:hypothetical protein
VRARYVPDEAVDRGSSGPLADNIAGIATWLDADERGRRGDQTRKRSFRLQRSTPHARLVLTGAEEDEAAAMRKRTTYPLTGERG